LGNIGVSLACPAINYLQIGSGNGGLNCGPISGSQLTLTNGANTTAITTTASGLSVNDPITVPAQTYPLSSSNQVSTISYVNLAIAAVGGTTPIVRTGLTYTIQNTQGNTYNTSNTISPNISTIFTTASFQPSSTGTVLYLNFNEPMYNGTYNGIQIQNITITNQTGVSYNYFTFTITSSQQIRINATSGFTFMSGNSYFINLNFVITST
jgi:hypothetical protein